MATKRTQKEYNRKEIESAVSQLRRGNKDLKSIIDSIIRAFISINQTLISLTESSVDNVVVKEESITEAVVLVEQRDVFRVISKTFTIAEIQNAHVTALDFITVEDNKYARVLEVRTQVLGAAFSGFQSLRLAYEGTSNNLIIKTNLSDATNKFSYTHGASIGDTINDLRGRALKVDTSGPVVLGSDILIVASYVEL